MRDLISREVKSTIITAKVVNVKTETIQEKSVEIYKVVLPDDAKKALQNSLSDNYMVMTIISVTPKSTMYGMSIEEFVLAAHPLDDKRRYIDTDSESQN